MSKKLKINIEKTDDGKYRWTLSTKDAIILSGGERTYKFQAERNARRELFEIKEDLSDSIHDVPQMDSMERKIERLDFVCKFQGVFDKAHGRDYDDPKKKFKNAPAFMLVWSRIIGGAGNPILRVSQRLEREFLRRQRVREDEME